MTRRPLPDSEDRNEQLFQRRAARAVLGLVLLAAMLAVALYLL